MPLPTLYDSELQVEQLIALQQGEILAPDEEAALKRAIEDALAFAEAKRDRVANTITWMLSQADLAEAEQKRLKERAEGFRNAAQRLSEYVIDVIRQKSADTPGKLKKLYGGTTTMTAMKCPPSVEITDVAAVPLKFMRAVATMPATIWNEIARVAPSLALAASVKMEVSKTSVKTAGHDVPGAKVVTDKLRLDIR